MDKLSNSEYGENPFKRSGARETHICIHTYGIPKSSLAYPEGPKTYKSRTFFHEDGA
jgi:hypothetical protein